MPTETELKSSSSDADREEFRSYLDKEGVLEYLTKQLVHLYEETEKPTSAIDYLKSNLVGKEVVESKQKAKELETEVKDLKKTIEILVSEKTTLKSKVAELENELKESRKIGTGKLEENLDDDANVKGEEKTEIEKNSLSEDLKSTESEQEPMETEENEIGESKDTKQSIDIEEKQMEEKSSESKEDTMVADKEVGSKSETEGKDTAEEKEDQLGESGGTKIAE